MRIASGLRAPNPKPSSGVSQRPSGDNLPDHRGSELVDNLLPTHNRTSFPGGFRFQSGARQLGSSDSARRFSMREVRTVINHLWSIRGPQSTTYGLFGSRVVSTLKCDDLVRRDEVF